MVEHKIKINSMTEFNLGDELILNDKLLESRKEYIVIKKEITLNDIGIDYTLQEKQDYLFGCKVVVSNSVEPGKFKLVNEEPLVQASKCKRKFTNIKDILFRVKSSDKNNNFERIPEDKLPPAKDIFNKDYTLEWCNICKTTTKHKNNICLWCKNK